jgi:hypothetical protein
MHSVVLLAASDRHCADRWNWSFLQRTWRYFDALILAFSILSMECGVRFIYFTLFICLKNCRVLCVILNLLATEFYI